MYLGVIAIENKDFGSLLTIVDKFTFIKTCTYT